jgi:hypothetical protein
MALRQFLVPSKSRRSDLPAPSDGVPSRAVLNTSRMAETVSAARQENACTDELSDCNGLSGKISAFVTKTSAGQGVPLQPTRRCG